MEKFSPRLGDSLTDGPSRAECEEFIIALDSEPQETPVDEATGLAARLLGSFVRGEVGDPVVYVEAVATVIGAYPRTVTRDIAHPLLGLPADIKFLPAVSEVKEWCDRRAEARKMMRLRAVHRIVDFDRAGREVKVLPVVPLSDEQRAERASRIQALVKDLTGTKDDWQSTHGRHRSR